MSEVTIEKQKEHIEKIKSISEDIHEYIANKGYKYESIYLGKEDLDVIQRALDCHMAVIQLDVNRRENQNE